MKSYSKIIPIDLYSRDILVVFGDEKYLRKSIRKYHTQEQTEAVMSECDINVNSKGRVIYSNVHNAFILWLPQLPSNPLDFDFLSHEIFHAANAIMTNIGASLSADSEEAYAYLIGFLTKRILEEFPICSFGEDDQEPASK